MEYTKEEKKFTVKWQDLTDLYRREANKIVKSTKLNYATLYPDNFEKQKVSLAMNIFNEKIVAALKYYGYKDTANFAEDVTNSWNCLNVKSTKKGIYLNDPNRKPFTLRTDSRLNFIVGRRFKNMTASTNKQRIPCLTTDTGG